MFVVLGVILVLTLLGFWGIQIAENDSRLSGGSVDIKSMNMAAISGLNMAVAQMSQDDDNLVAMINAFKTSVAAGTPKEWIVFDGPTLSLSSTDPGFTTSLGLDETSCKVRILGIEKIGASTSTLAITLESTGRGRNGDIHTAVATYKMTGLNSSQSTNSVGPVNALQSMGGFDISGFNQKVSAEGGVYSGGGTLVLQPPAGSNVCTRVRSAGNVFLSADIVVEENSVIAGYLKLNGGNATFRRNLVLYGDLANNTTLDVAGSMYFGGSALANFRSGTIKVGKDFLVARSQFVTDGPMTLGTSGSTDARAWFLRGINIDKSTAPVRTLYGSMYVRNDGTNDDGLRDFVIKKNFRYESASSSRKMRFNTTTVEGDAYFQGALSSGNKDIDGGPGLTVNGKATLLKGFVENWKQHNKFAGYTYWMASQQAGLVDSNGIDGSFQFGGEVSMNGTQASDWFDKWSFYSGPMKWSYTSMNSTPCSPVRKADVIKNGLAVTCRISDENAPDPVGAIPDTAGFTDSLHYTADDLDVANTNPANDPSKVALSNFSTSFLDKTKWTKIKLDYSNAKLCGDGPGPGTTISGAPSAKQIACIYANERNKYLAKPSAYSGPLYEGSDGLYTFLVIKIDGDWTNMSAGQEIPKGVHVMFIIDKEISVNQNWFTNVEGSTQVIYVLKRPSGFGWNGTVYGFVQFDVPNSPGLQLAGNMVLYGALESAQRTTTLQPNSGTLNVSITDEKARVVRDAIALAFTSNTPSKDIIRFSGDKGRTIKPTKSLTTNDGWVQFVRLGEYR